MQKDVYIVVAAILAAAAYILVTQEASAAEAGTETGANVSNGFGINNPLNIIYLANNAFKGQKGNHNGYGVYDTLADGVHAAGEQLTKYFQSGLTTVTQIITKWAPPSANNTAAYISDVQTRMNVDPNEPLSWPEDEVSLIQAMAWHENGYNPMSDSDVAAYVA